MTENSVWIAAVLSLLALSAVCIARHTDTPGADTGVRELSAPSLVTAQLEIRLEGASLHLSGRVPTPEQKSAVVVAARNIYGEANVTESIETGGNVAAPTWIGQTLQLFPLLKRNIRIGSVVIRDNSLILRAELSNEDAKTKLLREVIKATGEHMTVNDQVTIRDITASRSSASSDPLQGKIDQQLQGKTVEFDSGSVKIKAQSYKLLDEIASLLREAADAKVEIGGHTDNRGDEEKNLQLSQRRADAVKKYLAAKGIVSERLTTQGYGASQPLTDDESPEGLRQNRRIGFRVLENE